MAGNPAQVFFIGAGEPLSLLPLQAMIDWGCRVCGVGVAKYEAVGRGVASIAAIAKVAAIAAAPAPMAPPPHPLRELARRHHIPVIALRPGRLAADAAAIRDCRADIILVSCFPARLPDEVLAAARYGAVNCHPAPLPRYRGPAPLFWQYRDGAEELCMTAHKMTAQLDAGPIIATRRMRTPDGLSAIEINTLLARLLCETLRPVLPAYPHDTPLTPQDPARASYQSYPQTADFTLDTDWSARRAFNFMRATECYGVPYPCVVRGRRRALRHALAYSKHNDAALLPRRKDVLRVNFTPGTLVATAA